LAVPWPGAANGHRDGPHRLLARTDLLARWEDLERGFAAEHYHGRARMLRAWGPGLVDLGRGVLLLPARCLPDVVVTAVHGTITGVTGPSSGPIVARAAWRCCGARSPGVLSWSRWPPPGM